VNDRKVGVVVALAVAAGVAVIVASLTAKSPSSANSRSSPPPAKPRSSMNSRPSPPAAANPSLSLCKVALYQENAAIIFQGEGVDVNPLCEAWIRAAADGGELWQQVPPDSLPSELPQLVCVLSTDNGRVTATVDDTGGQIYGQEACTALLSNGRWTEMGVGTTTAATTTSGG
jgi:hypothetical protein